MTDDLKYVYKKMLDGSAKTSHCFSYDGGSEFVLVITGDEDGWCIVISLYGNQ